MKRAAVHFCGCECTVCPWAWCEESCILGGGSRCAVKPPRITALGVPPRTFRKMRLPGVGYSGMALIQISSRPFTSGGVNGV